jgi:hypothetical protein
LEFEYLFDNALRVTLALSIVTWDGEVESLEEIMSEASGVGDEYDTDIVSTC